MTWALLAVLLIVSAYAVYQHLLISRLMAPEPQSPSESDWEEDSALALAEALEASLLDDGASWALDGQTLVRKKGGVRLTAFGPNEILVEHEGSSSVATGKPAQILVRACRIRNSRQMIHALEDA